MTDYTVHMASGGVARWGNPVPTADGDAWFNYETMGTVKLAFEGAGTHYLNALITGLDRITPEGIVPEGFGHVQMQDIEGDTLFGRVTWFMEGEVDKGCFDFSGGTGKFAEASGSITAVLTGLPANLAAPFPPSGPMEFTGFTEGTGTLTAPRLAG